MQEKRTTPTPLRAMPIRIRWGIAGWVYLSVFLTTLSFPPFQFDFLSFVCLVPLLVTLDRSPNQAAQWSAIWGLGIFSSFFYWTLKYDLTTFLTCIALGTSFPCMALVASQTLARFGKPALRFYYAPASWVLLEWLIQGKPFYFPLSIAAALANQPQMTQIASLVGAFGVSFFILLSNRVIASAITIWLASPKPNKRQLYQFLGPISLLLLAIAMNLALSDNPRLAAKTTLTVALVQGNTPVEILNRAPEDHQALLENAKHYFEPTKSLAQKNPDLIIWPETAVRTTIAEDAPWGKLMKKFLSQANALLLHGEPYSLRSELFNSALLRDSNAHIIGRYDKQILTSPEWNEFSLSALDKALLSPWGKIGVMICFESSFPAMSRRLAKQGTRFLVILSNDAGFGNSAEPLIHAANARLRAIETGQYVLRVGNSGKTAVIASNGKILQELSYSAGGGSKTAITSEIFICTLRRLASVPVRDFHFVEFARSMGPPPKPPT